MYISVLPCYLYTTLTSSNMIIHSLLFLFFFSQCITSFLGHQRLNHVPRDLTIKTYGLTKQNFCRLDAYLVIHQSTASKHWKTKYETVWCRFTAVTFCSFLANVNTRSRLLYAIAPSVCLLSVTFVQLHPTQVIEIFGNVSKPFNTLAIRWHPGKILRRLSQGNASVGEVKHKRNIYRFWTYQTLSRKQPNGAR